MSTDALKWVIEQAPPMPAQLVATLAGLAYHADPKGRSAFPSLGRLAAYTCKSERSVRRDLRDLENLKLIRQGDQSKAAHITADKRPTVYDLAVENRVPKGRAGDDEGTSASARTLASSRARGAETRRANKARSEQGSDFERGDVHVRGDADVRPDVHVTAGGRGRPPNQKTNLKTNNYLKTLLLRLRLRPTRPTTATTTSKPSVPSGPTTQRSAIARQPRRRGSPPSSAA